MISEFTIAVHALVFLSHKGAVFSSEGLAANIYTNAARIRKVMTKLKKTDLVKTKEGVDGGYLFHRDSRDANLSMVTEALDTPSVAASWKSGNPHMACPISSGMAGIVDELYGKLNQCCQAYLEKVTIADLDSRIFAGAPRAVTAIQRQRINPDESGRRMPVFRQGFSGCINPYDKLYDKVRHLLHEKRQRTG